MAADYLPIEDHAAIGNLRSVALVDRDGSIDWCPLPGPESASVFAAVLDHRRGGRFQVRARGADVGTQAYIPHTNVLETSFDDGDERLVVTDCMPLRSNLDGVGDPPRNLPSTGCCGPKVGRSRCGSSGARILEFLPEVADDACRQWHERDYGLWEVRNGPFHFVYSNIMVWMGLDRATTLAEAGVIAGDVQQWRATGAQIREEVLQRGFDPELGAFRQSYERTVLDASNLLFPLLEFLPFDDPRVRSTIDATIEGLTENGLVHRYHAVDGWGWSAGVMDARSPVETRGLFP